MCVSLLRRAVACIVAVSMLCTTNSFGAAPKSFYNPGKEWIIIGVSTNLDYARRAAEKYKGVFWAIVVLKTFDGYYEISIGPSFTKRNPNGSREIDNDISRLIAEDAIPQGSFSTAGREFVDAVKVDFGNENAAYAGGFKEDRERKKQRQDFNQKMGIMLALFFGLAIASSSSRSGGSAAAKSDEIDREMERAQLERAQRHSEKEFLKQTEQNLHGSK
jgi:hypothetical protein